MGKIPVKPEVQAVSKDSYFSLAIQLGGRDSAARVLKKDPYSDALRAAGEFYGNREYVPAYECLKPAHDKAIADMQRVLARNVDFEASRIAKEQHKTLAAAKEAVQNIRVHAQQVIDQFARLMQDLEKKPLVRMHLQKARVAAPKPAVEDAPPTTLASTSETHVDARSDRPAAHDDVAVGDARYRKATYQAPEVGAMYCVRDKSGGDRIIRVVGKSGDDAKVQVVVLDNGRETRAPIELPIESLAKQALKGWCSLLVATTSVASHTPSAVPTDRTPDDANATMRLDIQNFARCCADIVRAKINFDTQRIKDVGDGPFRAGNYERAFLQFEQLATGFNAAVGNSRRVIADGRRELNDQKGTLSGKEIQERTAAFVRSEALIHTAEREFSTILEGLRMYLRTEQDSAKTDSPV